MLERATSRISVEKFFSGSIEKLRSGTLLCFTNFLLSKIFLGKRGRRRGEGGNIKICRASFFVSMPKKNRREPFSVSLIWGFEKFFA